MPVLARIGIMQKNHRPIFSPDLSPCCIPMPSDTVAQKLSQHISITNCVVDSPDYRVPFLLHPLRLLLTNKERRRADTSWEKTNLGLGISPGTFPSPVVSSIPPVIMFSGCPGQLEPHLQRLFKSSTCSKRALTRCEVVDNSFFLATCLFGYLHTSKASKHCFLPK
jgi:hypothetical protein